MYGGYARDVGQHINELASIPKVPRQILIYTEEQGGMGKGKLYPGGKKSPDNQRWRIIGPHKTEPTEPCGRFHWPLEWGYSFLNETGELGSSILKSVWGKIGVCKLDVYFIVDVFLLERSHFSAAASQRKTSTKTLLFHELWGRLNSHLTLYKL